MALSFVLEITTLILGISSFACIIAVVASPTWRISSQDNSATSVSWITFQEGLWVRCTSAGRGTSARTNYYQCDHYENATTGVSCKVTHLFCREWPVNSNCYSLLSGVQSHDDYCTDLFILWSSCFYSWYEMHGIIQGRFKVAEEDYYNWRVLSYCSRYRIQFIFDNILILLLRIILGFRFVSTFK